MNKNKKLNYKRFFFNRTLLIGLLILIQLLYFLKMFTVFGNYIYVALGGSTLITLIMLLYLINNKQNPMIKLSWSIIVFFFPILGITLYILIKIDYFNLKNKKNLKKIIKKTSKLIKEDKETLRYLENNEKNFYNLSKLIKRVSYQNVYEASNIKYFKSGEEKFEDMLIELKKAKKFIFLEYFIIERGLMWDSILNILVDKVKEGVEVRVMYDGTCAFTTLPYSYIKTLEELGIKAKMFSPIKPFITSYYNNRDHRKILVIDGKVAYIGGINLADEYINKKNKYGHWKDTAIKIKGNAVKEISLMFLQLYNINEKEEDYSRYLIENDIMLKDGFVIPYSDSPLDSYLLSKSIYLDIINTAKNYIYISTPYLIIDNEIMEALKIASLKGIKIKIVMPHIPDKEIPFSIAHTYYRELIEYGIKIYEYKKGFVHSKMFVVDDEISIVGTINLDYRSLYHNFECAVLIYKNKIINEIKSDFKNLFKESILVDNEFIKNDKIKRKLIGRLFKIIAPLM